MKKLLCYIILIIATSSCISRVENFGYIADDSDYASLQEGVSTKDRVRMIMGSPTLVTDFNKDTSWIYYSEKTDRFLFFKPKIIEREIILMRFDDNILRKLKKVDLAQGEGKLKFSSKETKVSSHKTGFFKSIFSNIGQVSAQ